MTDRRSRDEPETGAVRLPCGPRDVLDGWRRPILPVAEVIGMPSDEVAAVYGDEGFAIETYPYGYRGAFHENLDPRRIRLLVRNGVVVDATQG